MTGINIRDHRTGRYKSVIEIRGADGGYSFHPNENLEIVCEFECDCCFQIVLDPYYVYIITQLSEAGLMQENYPLLCCYCKIIFDNLIGGNLVAFSNDVWIKFMTYGAGKVFDEWFGTINKSINLDLVKILKENLSELKWKEMSKIL